VNDLVKLAEAIAASKADIPLEILVVAEDVIDGREACAEWYEQAKGGSGGETEKQNQGHRNFVDVLKRVVGVLKAKYEERMPKRQKQKPEKLREMREDLLSNIYEYLDVEEPSVTPLGVRQSNVPRTNHGAKPRKQPNRLEVLATDVEEAGKTFALWCFFKDQYDVGLLVKGAWQDYMDGQLSFATVCYMTDYAFMLMAKADSILVEEYPCFEDMHAIKNFLSFEFLSLDGGLTIVGSLEKKVAADACSDPSLHELFCTKASFLPQTLRERTDPEDEDMGVHMSSVSDLFSFGLQAILPEIKLLAMCDMLDGYKDSHLPLVNEDHFLLGLITMASTRRLPPWLVTAGHTCTHLYDVLGLRRTDGYKALHKDGPRIKQTLLQHLEHMESRPDWGSPDTTAKRSAVFKLMISMLDREVESDPIRELQKDFPVPELASVEMPEFRLQHFLPVSCGLLLFVTQQTSHVVGVMDSNTESAVLAAAHLYKAARLSGAIQDEWPDMEWFIKKHNQPRPFVLDNVNKSLPFTAAAKNYTIALGVKPSTALGFRRYMSSDGAGPGFQHAEVPSVNHSMKQGRLLNSSSCSPYVQHMQEEVGKNSSYGKGPVEWNGLRQLVLHKVAYAALDRRAAESDHANATKSKQAHS